MIEYLDSIKLKVKEAIFKDNNIVDTSYTIEDNIEVGSTITKHFNESYDVATIKVINDSFKPFKIGTPVDIITQFSEYNGSFIISKDSVELAKNDTNNGKKLWRHNLSLIESTCLLSRYMSDNISFPKVGNQKWTIRTALERLLRQATLDFRYIEMQYDFDDMEYDDRYKEVKEFQLSNNTLLNNINAILAMIDEAYITHVKDISIEITDAALNEYRLKITIGFTHMKKGNLIDNSYLEKTLYSINNNQTLENTSNRVTTWVGKAIGRQSVSSGAEQLFNTLRSNQIFYNNSDLSMSTAFNIAEILHINVLTYNGWPTSSLSSSDLWAFKKDGKYFVSPMLAVENRRIDIKSRFVSEQLYSTFTRERKELYYSWKLGTNKISFTTLSETENPIFTVNKFQNVMNDYLYGEYLNYYTRNYVWYVVNYYPNLKVGSTIIGNMRDVNNNPYWREFVRAEEKSDTREYVVNQFYGLNGNRKAQGNNDDKNFSGNYLYRLNYQIVYKPYLENLRVSQIKDNKDILDMSLNINTTNNIEDIEELGKKNKAYLDTLNEPTLTIGRIIKEQVNVFELGKTLNDITLTNNKEYVLTDYTILFYNHYYQVSETYNYNFNRIQQNTAINRIYRDVLKPSSEIIRTINIVDRYNNIITKEEANKYKNCFALITFIEGSSRGSELLVEATSFIYGDSFCMHFKLAKDNFVGFKVVEKSGHKELEPVGLYRNELIQDNNSIEVKFVLTDPENPLKSSNIYDTNSLPFVSITSLNTYTTSEDLIPTFKGDVWKNIGNKIIKLNRDIVEWVPTYLTNVSSKYFEGEITNFRYVYMVLPKGYYKIGVQAGAFGAGDAVNLGAKTQYPFINTFYPASSSTKLFLNYQFLAKLDDVNSLSPTWFNEGSGLENYIRYTRGENNFKNVYYNKSDFHMANATLPYNTGDLKPSSDFTGFNYGLPDITGVVNPSYSLSNILDNSNSLQYGPYTYRIDKSLNETISFTYQIKILG